jgi:hypothetical protein
LTFFTGTTSSPTDNERMRINPSGNIAIGTTSDDGYRANISGTLRTTGATWLGTTTRTVGIGTTTFTAGGASSFAQLLTSGSSGGLIINSDSGNTSRLFFTRKNSISDNEGLIRYNTGTFDMDFWTAAQPRLTITGSGESLFGTSVDAGDYRVQIAGGLYNTTGAVLAVSSGNVGIGTTSPNAKLDVTGAGAATSIGTADVIVLSRPTVSGKWPQFGSIKLGTYESGVSSSRTRMDFALRDDATDATYNTNTTALTLTSENLGSVGINVTRPDAKLHIVGRQATNVGNGLHVNAGTGSGDYAIRIRSTFNSTLMIYARGDGLIGMGTESPTEKLHVVGRARVTTIDSSASPTNMLWADNDGVIRKAAVPAGGGGGPKNLGRRGSQVPLLPQLVELAREPLGERDL